MEMIKYFDRELGRDVTAYISLKSNVRKFIDGLTGLGFVVLHWTE